MEVEIRQIRSSNRRPQRQRRTLAALGLGRLGQQVTHRLSPSVEGMIERVSHLVFVRKIS